MTDINALVERLRSQYDIAPLTTQAEAAEALTAQQQEIERLRGWLDLIATSHVPDQPAASDVSEANHVRQHVAHIRQAANKALAGTAGDGWRAMDSAPKDGTAVWLWGDGAAYIGYCEPADGVLRQHDAWIMKATFRRRGHSGGLPDDVMGVHIPDAAPTRWKPLPAPPAQEDGSC